MEYNRFIEIPGHLKIQVIRKCRPISYVRLRRSCRFVDGFCEKYRRSLGIYCSRDGVSISLDYNTLNRYVSLKDADCENSIEIPSLRENIGRINKRLSGFAFTELYLCIDEENEDKALNYFLEAAPDLKVNRLNFIRPSAEQVERVLSSKWKIGTVEISYPLKMSEILALDVIRNRDNVWLDWNEEDDDCSEQEIVQLARGKKRIMIQTNFLSASSRLNVLKAIVQNWKNDGEYPRSFYTDWCNDQVCMDADISGFYSETMGVEALHLGSFLELGRYGFDWETNNDIWIKMEENTKNWQLLRLTRSANFDDEITTEFRFKSGLSRPELYQELIKFLEETYDDFVFNFSPLYEAYHVTQNMEKFKEAFANIIPKFQEESSRRNNEEEFSQSLSALYCITFIVAIQCITTMYCILPHTSYS